MAGWHHWLNGHGFEPTLGESGRSEKPGVLQSRESQRLSDWTATTIKSSGLALWIDLLASSYFTIPFFDHSKKMTCRVMKTFQLSHFLVQYQEILGDGDGSPLQNSCLENSMGREPWQAAVHGDCKESDTTEWLTQEILFVNITTKFIRKIFKCWQAPIDSAHFCDFYFSLERSNFIIGNKPACVDICIHVTQTMVVSEQSVWQPPGLTVTKWKQRDKFTFTSNKNY